MGQVTIYNQGAGILADPVARRALALGRVPLRQALSMLRRGVATALDWVEGEYVGPYRKVTAVELVDRLVTHYVYQRTGRVVFSKQNLLLRDHYRCAYCGRTAGTVDHVVPRVQGGKTTWENCVASCQPCNTAKGGRTPTQAGMRLDIDPFVPSMEDLGLVRRRRRYARAA